MDKQLAHAAAVLPGMRRTVTGLLALAKGDVETTEDERED